jgi:hypothetical protein
MLSRKEMKVINGGDSDPVAVLQTPNYVYGGPGQVMLSQAPSNGHPTYPNGSSSAPVGGDAANEIRYFTQAVVNGLNTVASWFK